MNKRALKRLETCICFMLCVIFLGQIAVFADEPTGVVKPAHEFLFDNDSSSQIIDSGYNSTNYTQSSAGGFKYVAGYNGIGKALHFDSAYCLFSNDILPIGANSIRFKFKKDASSLTTHFEPIITATNSTEALFYMGIGNYNDKDNGDKKPGNLYIIKREYTYDGLVNFEMESPNSICDGQWHDILFTWDGTTNTNSVKLYIDDMTTPVLQKTAASTDTRKLGKVQLGGSNLLIVKDFYRLNAVLDNLQFYYSAINLNSTTPGDPTNPVDPINNKVLLVITMVTGEQKEYEMTADKINDFIAWYNSKAASSPTYAIEKEYNKASFTARKDYIAYEQISNFEVNEYNN